MRAGAGMGQEGVAKGDRVRSSGAGWRPGPRGAAGLRPVSLLGLLDGAGVASGNLMTSASP